MKAYNAAVKRWAIKLTINGKLTDKQICKIEFWILNTSYIVGISRDAKGLDDMLNDIYFMAKEMANEIIDRFELSNIIVETPKNVIDVEEINRKSKRHNYMIYSNTPKRKDK